MSVSGKLVLAIKMLLESQQYKAELNQAVSDTQAAAAKVEGSTKGMGDVVQQAVAGQSAAVRGAATAVGALGAIAGTAAVAAAAVGLAYHQAGQETLAFEKAIILTGNRAGVTSGQLADMARNIDGIAGTQANASAALAAITASGQVTRDNLQKVGLAAVEMERATGQSIGETAKIFASLGDAPVKASLRLNESMNYLTAGTYAQIKAAEDLGDKETAASIAQNAAADALRERAAKVEEHLGTLERAWRGVRDFAKEAWDAMLNVGREQTSGEKLETVRKRIAELENKIAANTGFGETAGGAATGRPGGTTRMQVELQGLQAQAAALAGVAHQASEAAKAQADKARVESAGIAAVNELGKANERAMTAQQKANKELEKYRDNVKAARAAYEQNPTKELAAFLDPKTIEKAEAAILKTGKASKAALSDVEKLTKAGEALTASLLAQDSGLSGDFSKKWESLSAAYRAGKTSLQELTAAQAALLAQQPLMKKAADEEAKATKELEKEREKALATLDKDLEKTLAAVAAQDEQNARLGLSKEAIAELDAAKLEMLATDMELQAANALFLNQDGEIYSALIKQANAYRELARAKREGGAKQASIDAAKETEKEAKKASDEWERAGERIEQSLTDSLMRGFESGKDFAKNLRDTVINMFNTMVLRPVISAIVNPVAGAVTGMMGLSGAANAAAAPSGVDVVGAISNGMSMLNTGISSAVQGTFSKFALSETGKSLGLSMAGPDASGYNMLSGTGQQTSQALGVVGDTLAGYAMGSMARSLISNGYSVGKGMDNFQRAGIAVGSALGGPVAGAIIGAGAGAFNQLFGRKLKDSGIQGTFGGTEGFDGERYDFYKGGVFRSDKTKTSPLDQGTTDGLTQQFRAIQLSTGLMAETLGLASGAVASFTKDIKLSFKGLTEEQIQEKMAAEFTAISDEMAGQVLGTQQSEYAKANETASQTLTRLATSLITANSAFELLGVAMLDASLASGDMASRLMEQSGGGEAFAANLGTYYENFYDQAEKTAYVTGQVTAALASVGLQMPKTREEFRALVESQIALGDSGTQAVAALLGVSGAFASVTENMKQLQSDTASLQIELLRAQGNTTGANAAQRTLDTTGFAEAEIALYDYNAALRAQIGALNEAAEQASIRSGFERQLLELQGDTAALRALDIAGMDAYNVSLYDQVQALTKATEQTNIRAGLERQLLQLQGDTAGLRLLDIAGMDSYNVSLYDQVQALTKATEQTNIRAGLERQLLQLQGDTAGLRLLDIAGMDSYNVSLYDQVQALTVSKAAEQDLAATRNRVAQERYGLETQLLQLQGNTAALRARELELIDPSNRALQEQIWAMEDQAKAVQASAAAAAEAASAAQQLKSAWASVTDSIFDEVRRIRGITAQDAGIGYAATQAQFSIATAQARAGDQEAAKMLPSLSQTLLTLAEANATTLSELQLIRDLTANSLSGTATGIAGRYGIAVPKFDVGTNYVPFDMLAQVHQGEMIVPAAFNPATMGGAQNTAALEQAINQMARRLDAAIAELAAIRNTSKDSHTLMRQVTDDGRAMKTREVVAV